MGVGGLIHLDHCLDAPLCGLGGDSYSDHSLWGPHLGWPVHGQPSTISGFSEC